MKAGLPRINLVPGGDLARLAEQAGDYIRHAKSHHTRRAYRSDWADFEGWCSRHAVSACPAEPATVALYVTDLAQARKPSTLGRRLATISQVHQASGYASPAASVEVRLVMTGIRRKKGTAPVRKQPLMAPVLAQEVLAMPETVLGLRNRALLLIGFAGALRRSELVALRWEQIERAGWQNIADIQPGMRGGLKITVQKSKTDQAGEGRVIGIPLGENPSTCPVRALEAWREAGGLSEGPVFRRIGRAGMVTDEPLSDKAVARLVKRVAHSAGLNPQQFSGHSLRSGLATSAAEAGASERSIMEQTGHRDLKTVRGYIRNGSLFRDNAAAKVRI